MSDHGPRSLIAAIDQGTTSSRAILFDRGGRIVASHQLEHRQITPRPGWVEHDPDEIVERVRTCVRVALREAGADARALAAVGISDQRETTVVWDRRDGSARHHAIVWQDTRTADAVARLSAGRRRAGPVPGTDRAAHLDLLVRAEAALDPRRARRGRRRRGAGAPAFGTIDAWLIWNLTGGIDGGVHVTDVTNASPHDAHGPRHVPVGRGDPRRAGHPRERCSPRSAARPRSTATGIDDLAGVPIAGDLGDQHAALFGQTCFDVGQAKCTYGTGAFMLTQHRRDGRSRRRTG